MLQPTDYRCDRRFLWLGITCTAIFMIFGVGSFSIAYWNIDGSFSKPKESASLFVLLWFGWVLLGAWITTSALRSHLSLTDESIVQTTSFRVKTARWRDFMRARWRLHPEGGSVVLRATGCRMVVEFGMFPQTCRPDIIGQIHRRILPAIQENWDGFEKRWMQTPPRIPDRRISRQVVSGMALLAAAGFFLFLWAAGYGTPHLYLCAVNVLAATWNIRSARRSRAAHLANSAGASEGRQENL